MDYINTLNRREMTETQLREAIKRLEAMLEKGEGTVSDANALADYRRQLDRIRSVKYGRNW